MSDTTAGVLQVALLIAALAACYRPLGAYIAQVYTSEHDTRIERVIYRVIGVDPKADQRWPSTPGRCSRSPPCPSSGCTRCCASNRYCR